MISTNNFDITKTLTVQARKGNQEAMYKLYKMYVQAMFNISIRIVTNQLDAEDIVQEAFTSAFVNLGTFKGDTTFGAWLKRIVINKSINHVKKQKFWFADSENLPDTVDDDDNNDDFMVGDSELTEISPEKINDAIKTLPQKAKVIFNLYLLEGYQHKDIAEMLNISVSTSKSQYQRARKLLQEKLLKSMNN